MLKPFSPAHKRHVVRGSCVTYQCGTPKSINWIGMTQDTLFAIRLFVKGMRQKSLFAAKNCELNGYKSAALEHENEVALADQILLDLSRERVAPNAEQKADY